MDRPAGPVTLSPSASRERVARAPDWIRERKLDLSQLHGVKSLARSFGLSTVCEEARCPNRSECFARGTATFLLLGDVCTRACGFCDIATGRPAPPDPFEPARLASAAGALRLAYVVVTSVDRDDLPDGGAAQFVSAIRALRRLRPAPGVEVLVPDFRGRFDSLRIVVEERPDVFNHNVETVGRLYSRVRRGAVLDRSLGLLAAAKELAPDSTTKSGFMVGLGETEGEIRELLAMLRDAAVDIVTIGQYLRPSRENLPVEEYVPPSTFENYREMGERLGFRHVFAGPFVRSSYRAEEALLAASFPVIPRPEGLSACHSEERSDEESAVLRSAATKDLSLNGRDPSLRSG